MIAQEEGPLAGFRNSGCLLKNIHNGDTVLEPDRHENPGHQRKMKRHVALVPLAGAKVGYRFLGPLVSFGQQHAVAVLLIHVPPQGFKIGMSFGKVLARGALALV